MTKEGFALLMQQPWYGNIRELEGVVRNLLLFANGKTISRDLIQMQIGMSQAQGGPVDTPTAAETLPLTDDQTEERRKMLEFFKKHSLDKVKVSEELGISLKSVYARMKRLGIPKKKQELHQFIQKNL